MVITVDRIKAIIASYWRYGRQFPLVALEASSRLDTFNDGGQADILAVTQHRLLIETEVKVSLADFRRDRNKLKHKSFREHDGLYPTSYFYFAVPKYIANKACFLCDSLYPYAGILGTDGHSYYDVLVYRNPKMLSGRKLSLLEIVRMAREQSATLCRLAEELAGLKASRFDVLNLQSQGGG